MNKEKVCAYCGELFIPNSSQQIYCKRPHYMNCPICGNKYLVTYNEKLKFPPTACSYKCRQAKARQTNIKKYGAEIVFQTEGFKEKSKQTMIDKYGVEYALSSPEIQKKSKQTLLRKYGVDNAMKSEEIQKKAESTNIERYGSKTFLTSEKGKEIYMNQLQQRYNTDHPLHSSQIKQKWVQTNLEKYGADYFTQSEEGKQKIRQAVRLKYGVNSVTQLESVKQKMKDTFLRNYGVDNPSKNKNIKEKIKQTMITKYGSDNVMQIPSIREKIIQTNMSKFGVPFSVMAEHVRMRGSVISKLNKNFAESLQNRGVGCGLEFRISRMGYDIIIPELKLLIEINPSYTHNVIGNHWSKNGLKLGYHANKAEIAQNAGYDIRCIFDWDSETELIEEIVSSVNPSVIQNSATYILTKQAGCAFLNKYGRARISQYPRKIMIFGVICEKEIVQAIAIGLNNHNSNSEDANYRILNYGTRWNMNSENGYNKILELINQFIPLDDICCYIDADRFKIQDIQDLNININSIQRMNPVMYWSKKSTRIPVRAKCSNIQFIDEGWLPVEDCGKIRFVLSSINSNTTTS